MTLLGLLFSVRVWGCGFTHLTKNNNGLSYDGISTIMQGSPAITSDCEAARESFTELIVIEPGYFSENSGATVVCRATFATVRLSEMPTCVEVFTAPMVLVVEPDITKPPEQFSRIFATRLRPILGTS